MSSPPKCPQRHEVKRGVECVKLRVLTQSIGTPASRYNVDSATSPSAAASSNPSALTSRPASRSARTLRRWAFADTSRDTFSSREITSSSLSRARPPTDTSNPSTHSCGSALTRDSFSACKVRQFSPTSTSTSSCPARHAVTCIAVTCSFLRSVLLIHVREQEGCSSN